MYIFFFWVVVYFFGAYKNMKKKKKKNQRLFSHIYTEIVLYVMWYLQRNLPEKYNQT
jgi:hypothetical protein